MDSIYVTNFFKSAGSPGSGPGTMDSNGRKTDKKSEDDSHMETEDGEILDDSSSDVNMEDISTPRKAGDNDDIYSDVGESNKNKDNNNDQESEDFMDQYMEIPQRRLSHDREGNCYCGKDRNLNIVELLCVSCYRWFHESCIGYQLSKLTPFMSNYLFMCKNCSPTGLETFKRSQAQFSQMCVTVLANLTQASVKEGQNKKFFSKDREIIPFLDMHWDAITTQSRRVTQTWHATVTKTLQKESDSLFYMEERENDPDSPYYSLRDTDLTHIKPCYDSMIRSGHLKVADGCNTGPFRSRGAKRRTVGELPPAANQPTIAKKVRGENYMPKLTGNGYPADHPSNKEGFRYFLAEPDSCAPFRQEFDESSDYAGKVIPGWLYRVLNPQSVLLAMHDRASQLKLSDDRLSVTGEKGYCMVRATHGVRKGAWYFEATITDMPEGAATRIGFSQPYGNLQGPLGFDKFGYSWRSLYGTKFHEARGKSYAKPGYGLGDVLGFMIHMPEPQDKKERCKLLVPPSQKDKPLLRIKSHLYYEVKDVPADNFHMFRRKGSYIACFKNGISQGAAFTDLIEGTYFPAVSIYKGATVKLNFGPNFWCPPKGINFGTPFSELAEQATIEQAMADMLFLTEHQDKLRLD